MLTTKTFWVGLAKLLAGVAFLIFGSTEAGVVLIGIGVSDITQRHATIKLQRQIRREAVPVPHSPARNL